jgi:CubicO group peptidase (beta-lactamase class C family)
MPKLIKLFLILLLIMLLAILGLLVSGNDHLLLAVKSTYLQGSTGPDIDNDRFFENRTIEARSPKPWKRAAGYNSYSLGAADSILLDSYKTTGFLVAQEGELVFEDYWETYSDSSYSNSFSMAKSFTSLLVGVAIEEGLIGSVQDKASEYIPELRGTDREQITIEQLLQMTSGIGFDERYGDPFGFMAKAYYGDELLEKTLSYERSHEPGTYWEYLGGNTLLLSFIVENVTGKTLSQYASQKLWTPIGAEEDALWTYDPSSGRERAYCCFYSNAKDFARIGHLIMCDGNWNGKQLISADWIEASMRPVMVPDATGRPVDFYGYQWWITRWNNREVFYARGILGQYIFIIPETQTVVVRLGHLRSDERENGVPKDVFEYLDLSERIRLK